MSPEQAFCDAYLDCALWASTDAQENPLDDGRFDWRDAEPAIMHEMVGDCLDFIGATTRALNKVGTYAQHGHDFWLTRNHHGAGFWDRGYGAVGDVLTALAHEYGEAYLDADDFAHTPPLFPSDFAARVIR